MIEIKEQFVGRRDELDLLNGLLDKSFASLVVIYGRRRIGKSRLIAEFGRKFTKACMITGLHPRLGLNNQNQLDSFSNQMAKIFKREQAHYVDWNDAFYDLAQLTAKGQTLIVLDEITWLGACDPDFLGKLKIAWDQYFKNNPRLVMVLCGSVSAWISRNILLSTGYYGRISLTIRLRELSLKECATFWGKKSTQFTAHELFKILAVTGGVPKYLEEIKPLLSADENIKALCFLESGLLFQDFTQIFTDILQRKSQVYFAIVKALVEKNLSQKEMLEQLAVSGGGSFKEYLDELVLAGFVSYHKTWNLKNGKISSLGHYRLSDNYLRFYLKYIQPNIEKISAGMFQKQVMSSLPGWSAIMSLQVENLVLNNRHEIIKQLGINPAEIQCDNPYFQRATKAYPGCQIDYLIQTEFNTLYVCEIKFTRQVIHADVIKQVQKKIAAMVVPKNMAIKPVLIHLGDVHDTVYDAHFFAKILDLGKLLE